MVRRPADAAGVFHVPGHLPDIQKTFLTKHGGRVEYNELAAGRAGRTISLVGALVAGMVLAIALVPPFWSVVAI